MSQPARPHVDFEEAALEGGMSEPEERCLETTASGLVISQARETLLLLVSGLTEHNAIRLLAQISKVATSSRQTVAIFDPSSGVELDGLSPRHQKAMMKAARPMNRETTGVEAMKQVVGMLQGHHQANNAKQLNDVLAAAERARSLGNTSMSIQLEERANLLAVQLLGDEPASVDTEALAKVALHAVSDMADAAEGFSSNSSDSIAFSSSSTVSYGSVGMEPLPAVPISLEDAEEAINDYIASVD